MTIYILGPDPDAFPDPARAESTGLLALGGDLRPERLLAGYRRGIFPWYGPGQPILWHSPDPRFVLAPERLHVPRSLEKVLRRGKYAIRADTAFAEVVAGCARAPRPGQDGTWITDEMATAYGRLHALGFAHSVEAFSDGVLIGGVYGVALGSAFFGESMFTNAPDASKAAFAVLARALRDAGCRFIDCQVETAHLTRFGAEWWPRGEFLRALALALEEQPLHRAVRAIGRAARAGAPG